MPKPTNRAERSDISVHGADDGGTWDIGAHDTLLWRVGPAGELRVLFVPGSAAEHLAGMDGIALEHRKRRRREENLFGALAALIASLLAATIFLCLAGWPLLPTVIVVAPFSIVTFFYVRSSTWNRHDYGERFGLGESGDQNRLRHRAGVVSLVVPTGIGPQKGSIDNLRLVRRVLDGITPQLRDDLIVMSNDSHQQGVREVLEALVKDEDDRRRRKSEARQRSDQRDTRRLVEVVLERARRAERQRQRKAQG